MDVVGQETLETMEKAGWYNAWLFELISPFLKGDILEIGSGIGNFTGKLLTKGRVWASDINDSYVKKLQKSFGSKVHAGLSDIETGRYFFDKKKKFDTIVCLNVLEHIKDDQKALQNMHGLLRSGGVLLMIVPAHKLLLSNFDRLIGHYRRYTVSDMSRKLHDAGFISLKVRYYNWFGAIGWFVFLKLLRYTRIPNAQLNIFDRISPTLLLPEKFIKLPFGLSVYAVAYK